LGPTERQMLALMLKSKGLTLTEIARILGTSKQNVVSLIRRGKQNVEKYEKMYKIMRACESKIFTTFEKGTKLYDVAEEIMKIADKVSIKLRGNVNDVASYVKMEGDVEDGELASPHGVALCEDGRIIVLTGEALEEFSKLLLLYQKVRNKGEKPSG